MQNNNDTNNITLLNKYYPRTWDDLILPSRVKDSLKAKLDNPGFRLLLHSSPGTGKTTTSRIITKGHDVMYLSGSNDFTVEILRKKVLGFAAGMQVQGKKKTIIIDECEHIRANLQDAFKILFDRAINVNFIFITNEVEKVRDPIVSRCTGYDYDFGGSDLEEQKKLYIKFALNVCNKENIVFENSGLKALFILKYPDFRNLLVQLQEFIDNKLPVTVENVKQISEIGKPNQLLYDIIEKPIFGPEFYLEITKFKGREKDAFYSLGEPFFTYLNDKNLHDKTLKSALIVAKYSDMYVSSINKFVTLLSCIVELKSLFK